MLLGIVSVDAVLCKFIVVCCVCIDSTGVLCMHRLCSCAVRA